MDFTCELACEKFPVLLKICPIFWKGLYKFVKTPETFGFYCQKSCGQTRQSLLIYEVFARIPSINKRQEFQNYRELLEIFGIFFGCLKLGKIVLFCVNSTKFILREICWTSGKVWIVSNFRIILKLSGNLLKFWEVCLNREKNLISGNLPEVQNNLGWTSGKIT